MRLIKYALFQRGVKGLAFLVCHARMHDYVFEIIEPVEHVPHGLDISGIERVQSFPLFLEYTGAYVRQSFKSGTVHYRNGRGAVLPRKGIVVIVEILCHSHKICRILFQQSARDVGVYHSVGENFLLGKYQIIADILHFVRHFDAPHKAGIENDIIQFERDGCCKILHIEFLPRTCILSDAPLLSRCRTCATPYSGCREERASCQREIGRNPTGGMGREYHPVFVTRIVFLYIRQHIAQHVGVYGACPCRECH